MADSNYNYKLLSIDEGLKSAQGYPGQGYFREFFDFIKNNYGLAGGFLAVYENEKIAALIPANISGNRVHSVYKDYTEPFFFSDDKNLDWLRIIKDIKQKFNYEHAEFNFTFINNQPPLRHFTRSPISCYVLKLGDNENQETILGKFKKKTRNETRKAQKAGLIAKVEESGDLDAIYGLYQENMDRHGTPKRPREFFINLFDSYKSKYLAVTAYDKASLVGVNIVLVNGVYLRLMYNFSRVEYWPECINNLLYFKMIERGYSRGVRYFDYGPSLNTDQGNIHFKTGFGGVPVPLLKLTDSQAGYVFRKWLEQKRYNLKIRINKIKKQYIDNQGGVKK